MKITKSICTAFQMGRFICGKPISFKSPKVRGDKISKAMKERDKSRPDIRAKMISESVKKCSKSVLQKSAGGVVVATWPSAAAIERALGINHAQISRACKTLTQCHGYFWEFL